MSTRSYLELAICLCGSSGELTTAPKTFLENPDKVRVAIFVIRRAQPSAAQQLLCLKLCKKIQRLIVDSTRKVAILLVVNSLARILVSRLRCLSKQVSFCKATRQALDLGLLSIVRNYHRSDGNAKEVFQK